MKTKSIIGLIVTIVAIITGVWFYNQDQSPTEITAPTGESTENQGGTKGEAGMAKLEINPN